LLAAIISSRSFRGPHKRGNGIDQGLEHFRQDGLGRTLLAGFCEQWIGPPGRSVANSQAMTNTKSFRLERYAGRLPPSSLIAGAMDRAMMDPTEGTANPSLGLWLRCQTAD
jgi:hypothetical protein